LQNAGEERPDLRPRELEERWLLGRLDAGRAELEELLGRYDFAGGVRLLYRLTFDDFCDWYAEAIKPRLYDGDADARATALGALERLLKLLHPVMPHVTEEIWSQFHDDRLIVAAWPEPDGRFAEEAKALDRVQQLARIFRRSGVIVELEGDERRIFDAVVKPQRAKADGGNLEAELDRLRGEIGRSEGMLENKRFVQNAPDDVVEAEREKLERYRRELDALSS
jgi:valyl-tRNA synthetase